MNSIFLLFCDNTPKIPNYLYQYINPCSNKNIYSHNDILETRRELGSFCVTVSMRFISSPMTSLCSLVGSIVIYCHGHIKVHGPCADLNRDIILNAVANHKTLCYR